MDEHTYPLPTDTAHVHIESRQYKLGIDLGEGVRRMALLMAAVLIGAWTAVLWLLGVSFWSWFAFYLGPPIIGTVIAMQPDAGDRYRYVAVVDWLRWRRRRRQPLIPLPGDGSGGGRPIVISPSFRIIDNLVKENPA